MQLLPGNRNTTALLIDWPHQLHLDPKVRKLFQKISFPQRRSSPIWGGSHGGNQCHRDKLLMCSHFKNALVARPVGQKEINNTPAAQAALDKEWNNLTSIGAWDYPTVLGNQRRGDAEAIGERALHG